MITSDYYSVHTTFDAGGRKKLMPHYHPEKIIVYEKCPNCGKSKKEIKELLESGGITKSHEERLKRLKEGGLPTRIVSKRT